MVSFGEAIKTCLKTKIFNWHDRAPRSEFWWFILFATIAQYVLALFMLIPFIGVLIYVVAYVYILWAQFMVSIRRLHDKNRSGWWLILNIVLMVIGSVFLSAVIFLDGLQGGYHDGDTISTILMGIGIIFFLAAFVIGIFIFVMMVTAGTVGPNRFGPDPLALARQEEAMRQQFYQQQAMYGQGMGSNNAWGQEPWGQQPPQGQQAPWGQQPPQGQEPWGQQPPQGQAPWGQQPPQGQQGYYGPQDQQWSQAPQSEPVSPEQWPVQTGDTTSSANNGVGEKDDAQFSSPQQNREQQNPPRN